MAGDLRSSLTSYHRLAVSAAKAAGRLLAGYRGRELAVTYKGAVNIVTEADRQAERLIAGMIGKHYPGHIVVGEEGSGTTAPLPAPTVRVPVWFVDPLDGTTNFAHGFPFYCVSIGVEVEGRMMVGVVYDPVRKELFSAIRGRGAFCNGRRLGVSTTEKLDQSLLVTGFAYNIRTSRRTNLGHFSHFSLRCRGVRRTGSAALDLCYVAGGRFDGFWEMNLWPWDTAAGSLIVEEAGGRMSGFEGRPYDLRVPELVASNGRIHEEMLAVLRLGDRIDARMAGETDHEAERERQV
ncbi:MAG TPA: inositol monophosphatase family protein [Nitrospiria bacterium]|nr:inositol monophosphatase family protein [Nitrospiria bacterium]